MLTSTHIKLAIAAVALVAAAGVGWTVNGWRLAGEIRELQGVVATQKQSIETLAGANQRCVASVVDVKGAVKAYVDASDARAEAARKAMEQAARASAGHLAAAKAALDRPMPKAGEECGTAAAEAAAYARRRKGAP